MIRAALPVSAVLALVACTSAPRAPANLSRAAAANEAWRKGDASAGRRHYGEALREDHLASDETATVRHLNNLAALEAWTGRDRAAEERIVEAIARCAGPGAEADRRRLEMQRAALLLRRGDAAALADATTLLVASPIETWARDAAPADASQYWALRSSLALRSGRRADAADAARRAREAASVPGAPAESRAAAALALGRALDESATSAEARAAFDEALDSATEARHPWLRLAALRALASVCDGEERTRFARLAADLAEELAAAKEGT